MVSFILIGIIVIGSIAGLFVFPPTNQLITNVISNSGQGIDLSGGMISDKLASPNVSDMEKTSSEIIEKGKTTTYSIIDKIVDPVNVTKGNPLETTESEKQELKKSGKGLLNVLVELGKVSHTFSEALINALSPYDIKPEVLFVAALVAAGIIFWRFWKVLIKHTIYAIIIVVIVLVILMMLGISSFS